MYWIFTRKTAHDGVIYKRLGDLTIDFFSNEPSVQEKLENKGKRIGRVNHIVRLKNIEKKYFYRSKQ